MATTSPFKLHPNPPQLYDEKYIVFIQIRYSYVFDTTEKKDKYLFEFQFEKRIPVGFLGFSALPIERSEWTVIDPTVPIDIKIKDGDTFVVIETVDNGLFTELFWSINKDAIMTLADRMHLYGDLQYGDGTNWQELADYKRDHPGDSRCRWISFKAKLSPKDPDPPKNNHKFSYNFYLRNSSGMEEIEVDPDIKNPSA